LELTPARLAFRRTAGKTGRDLNTLLIAIKTLHTAVRTQPEDGLLGWSMPTQAADGQTRSFVMKPAITTVIDGIDRYMKVLSRIPGLSRRI